MIFWKDFILDDVVGPILAVETGEQEIYKVCRRTQPGHSGVMDDAMSAKQGAPRGASSQETRRMQRPARMVGHTDLDSALSGMEAGSNRLAASDRQSRREG